jgi:hypothetical protein
MGNIATIEAGDLELEKAGSNSDSDFDSAEEAKLNHFFLLIGRGTSPQVAFRLKARQMPLNIASAHCLGRRVVIAARNFKYRDN